MATALAFFFETVFIGVSDCVCRFDCGGDHIGRNGEGHIVNGFFGDAGLFRNRFEKLVVDIIGAEVFETYGKTYRQAEVENFVKFVFGAVFKDKLADCAESDHFAVIVFGVGGKKGKTVVDCVRRGKSARFEAETRKKNVGFDNSFESGGYDVLFASGESLRAVRKKGFIAKFRKRSGSHRAVSEHFAGRAVSAARKTCVDVAERFYVCASFEVG